MAPHNLAMINPLGSPHINMKGCHVSRDGDLQGLRNGQRGSLLCLQAPLSHRHWGSWLTSSDSWSWLGYGHSGNPINVSWQGVGSLAGMNGIMHPKGGHTSLQHWTQPWPVPPFGGLQPPSNWLPCRGWWPAATNAVPKRKNGEMIYKGSSGHMAMKQLKIEREINTRNQEGIPGLVALGTCFQSRSGTLPTFSQVCTQSISYCSLVEALAFSGLPSSDDSSSKRISSHV